MSYCRLLDVKTPPFAYVVNRDQALTCCDLCMAPFPDLAEPLRIEILTTEVKRWRDVIEGKPMMAEHWLIGDQGFVDHMRSLCGDFFSVQPVRLISWLSRSPMALNFGQKGRGEAQEDDRRPPRFFALNFTRELQIAHELADAYPGEPCERCGRSVPEIPIDLTLYPEPGQASPPIAHLRDFPYEGYDYLFEEDLKVRVAAAFPTMIFEPITQEPTLF